MRWASAARGLSSCDDSTGASTSSGGPGHLDTSTPGAHTYTVTATSSDGQSATAQISYTVAAAPTASITAPPSGRTFTVGQSVRTRFSCSERTGGPGLSSCDDSTGARTRTGGSGHLNTSTRGRHRYRVTATSKDGQTASTQITYTVKARAPRLSALTLIPRAFSAATTGPTISTNPDAGALIRYRDLLAAHSTLTVLRCAGSSRGCAKLALTGAFSHRDHAGSNSLRFTGRLHGHALAPGRYLLKVTATLAGQRSPAIRTSFLILAPPPVCGDHDHDGDCDPRAQTAATPSCGTTCVDFSNALYGTSSSPTFVLADVPQAQNVGQPLTLARASVADAGEDFVLSFQGSVSDFITLGIIAPGMAPYDSLGAYELEYAPFGVTSGLCVGVGVTPANGTEVALEPCGVSAKTVWIIDSTNPITTSDAPLINGATNSNFSNPQVLSTLLPGLPLLTSTLQMSSGNTVIANQLWGAKMGAL